MADRPTGQEPVYVNGLCIICQHPPKTCPKNALDCLNVGLLDELRAENNAQTRP